ncbi:polyphosphate kinase 1 [bacterium]|nr:polyphosphate kinase 1 [bacterium]
MSKRGAGLEEPQTAAGQQQPIEVQGLSPDSPEAYFNRDLSWLAFAQRVLAQVEDPGVPLLERLRFAGIMGVLHDEFFQKRATLIQRGWPASIADGGYQGWTPQRLKAACREVIDEQSRRLGDVFQQQIRPALREAGIAILDYSELSAEQKKDLAHYFQTQVQPILTPLAVDAEHPFPFISNLGLNLGIQVLERGKRVPRFVRLKVPGNRPRWVPLPDGAGYVPLEQVISAHLADFFPDVSGLEVYTFRVTRGEPNERHGDDDGHDPELEHLTPGLIVSQVERRLLARRFAKATRLQVSHRMPEGLRNWLAEQLELGPDDIYLNDNVMGKSDLTQFRPDGHPELRFPAHEPQTHPRLRRLLPGDHSAIFEEIRRGDILLHHPYQSFDTSVLRFLESAARDPRVLAMKLTIYRTSSDSPIIRALLEAARSGKQVAVLVEITARFDEAPNIAWGQRLESAGAHVTYGIENLKTHLKLALVVREEEDGIRRYVHCGTGNYHSGTARAYVDLGLFSCDPQLSADVADVFNELTSATDYPSYRRLVVAPDQLRQRFTDMIRREAEHALAGRPCGIRAKMNQLSDMQIIRELYLASQAGVPIELDVRGLCCLRPGVPGLSESIRVFSVVGRFLEHSRLYRFENGGQAEYFIGSADWMQRNLDRRIESVTPVAEPELRRQLDAILQTYEADNCSAWDLQPDGSYLRRSPAPGGNGHPDGELLCAQERFINLAGLQD